MCKRWATFSGDYFTYYSNSVKYIIVILNLIVRIFFMKIAEHMGFANESKKFEFIKTGVFFAIFF